METERYGFGEDGKLVRDKIWSRIEAEGGKAHGRKLSRTELVKALKQKLIEEADELKADDPKATEELADIFEVVEQLRTELGITPEALAAIVAQKREQNGGFESGDFIESAEIPVDSEWIEYFRSHPDQYPCLDS